MAENNNFAMLSLVGIVAVVGIVGLIFMNSGNQNPVVAPSTGGSVGGVDSGYEIEKNDGNVAGEGSATAYAPCAYGRVSYSDCAALGARNAGDCCDMTAEGLIMSY